MRGTHDGKPFRAVGGGGADWYREPMKSLRLPRLFGAFAALAFVGTLTTWAATGAHFGWTRTQAVIFKQDEVTGIDYPVHVPTFVAGVEVLAVGLALAVALAGSAAWLHRRAAVRA
jgi:hypothetical protein